MAWDACPCVQFHDDDLVTRFMNTFVKEAKVILPETIDCVVQFLGKAKGNWVPGFLVMLTTSIRRLGEASYLWGSGDDASSGSSGGSGGSDLRRDSFAIICAMLVQVLQLQQKVNQYIMCHAYVWQHNATQHNATQRNVNNDC